MRVLAIIISLLLLQACTTIEDKVSVKTRESISQEFYLLQAQKPIANVLLFTGGKGKINSIGKANNFLLRSRRLFLDQGFTVASLNAPSDQQSSTGMYGGFRNSDEHAKDISKVVAYLKQKNDLPVWLIGTSRGTESVARGAIALGDKIDGIVLTSSMSVPNDKGTMLLDMTIDEISVPTFVVAHEQDNCWVTPADGANEIAKQMVKAKPLKVKFFSGGYEKGRKCGAMSYHGFLGIENQVVKYISNFIKNNQGEKL